MLTLKKKRRPMQVVQKYASPWYTKNAKRCCVRKNQEAKTPCNAKTLNGNKPPLSLSLSLSLSLCQCCDAVVSKVLVLMSPYPNPRRTRGPLHTI